MRRRSESPRSTIVFVQNFLPASKPFCVKHTILPNRHTINQNSWIRAYPVVTHTHYM